MANRTAEEKAAFTEFMAFAQDEIDRISVEYRKLNDQRNDWLRFMRLTSEAYVCGVPFDSTPGLADVCADGEQKGANS